MKKLVRTPLHKLYKVSIALSSIGRGFQLGILAMSTRRFNMIARPLRRKWPRGRTSTPRCNCHQKKDLHMQELLRTIPHLYTCNSYRRIKVDSLNVALSQQNLGLWTHGPQDSTEFHKQIVHLQRIVYRSNSILLSFIVHWLVLMMGSSNRGQYEKILRTAVILASGRLRPNFFSCRQNDSCSHYQPTQLTISLPLYTKTRSIKYHGL